MTMRKHFFSLVPNALFDTQAAFLLRSYNDVRYGMGVLLECNYVGGLGLDETTMPQDEFNHKACCGRWKG